MEQMNLKGLAILKDLVNLMVLGNLKDLVILKDLVNRKAPVNRKDLAILKVQCFLLNLMDQLISERR
jgi:hypothetical protein